MCRYAATHGNPRHYVMILTVMRLSRHEYTNSIATSVPENHLIPSLVQNVIGTPVE
jgi:hypothetical protein